MSKSVLAVHIKACSIGLIFIAGALAAGCTAQVRVAPAVAVVAPAPAVAVQIYEAPPPLPLYEQPPCPVAGYLWTPGYWAYAPSGYYWVPGTWVEPPRIGVLWTPGYWGFGGGVYAWHAGYWGPHIGFYGGVNYGFGYVGTGFVGGRWVGNSFAYNNTVTNVNVTVVHNTYNETVVNNVAVTRVSYNGGAGGILARPTAQEKMAAQEPHLAPTPLQQQHVQEAAKNPALFAKANGGHPAIAATTHPASFTGPGVVGAKFAAHPPTSAKPPAAANAVAPKPPVATNAAAPKPPVAANAAQPKPPKPPKKPVHEYKPEGEKS
jgi:hypothetical protein